MHTVSRILKNTTVLVASNILVKVLGAFLIIMLGRYLGDDGFGEYSFAFSFVAMFIIVSDFGLDALVIRNVARSKDEAGQYLEKVGILRIGLSALMVMIAVIGAYVFSLGSQTIIIILFAGLTYMFDKISGLFYAIFRAFERMGLEAVTQIIWRVAQVSLGLVAMNLGYSLLEIIIIFLVMSVVRCIIGFTIVLAIGVNPTRDGIRTSDIAKNAIPFAAYEIGHTVYINLVIVLLFLINLTTDQVGWFSASYRMLFFLLLIPSAFETAIYPVFSRLFSEQPGMMRVAYAKSMKFSLLVVIPSTFALYFFAEPLAGLFGADFNLTNTARCLQIIAFALPFLTLNMIMKTALWSSDRPMITARNIFFAAFVLGTVAYFLIYNYGFEGGAWAFLIGEICLFVLNYLSVRIYVYKIGKYIWKPVIGGCAMSGILYTLYIFSEATLMPSYMIVIATLAYLLVIIGLSTITDQDKRIIMIAFGRSPRTPR